jgi:hypothetical protein
VAAGFVPVTELIGDLGEIERDAQQQRMVVAVPVRTGIKRIFQDAPGS